MRYPGKCLPGLLAVAVALWLEGPVLAGWFVDLTHDPNYSHGLAMAGLLLAVGLWRSWRRPSQVDERYLLPWWGWGAIAFVLSAAGLLSSNDSLQRWGAVAIALLLLELQATAPIRSAWRGPLLALVTLVPWPYVVYYAVTARLQSFSSWAAAAVLQLSGVPLVRSGNLLTFPGYRLEVVEACSGLRSLLAMTALAALVAVLARVSARRTLLLLLLAVPLALVANLLRLVVTGYAAQLGGPAQAEGVFHMAEGLFTFGLGAIVLGWVAFSGRSKGELS